MGPGQGCDRQFAEAKVNALFSAINRGDFAAVENMFPNPQLWQFTAVSSGVATSAGEGIRIEPRPDAVSRLLGAVNQNDTAAVQRMFLFAGGWDFELVPSVDAAIAGHTYGGAGIRWTSSPELPNRVDMRKLLSQFSGLHLTFTAPLKGGAGQADHASLLGTVRVREAGVGPVLWRATGSRIQERGKRAIYGGGKITIYCERGLFMKVLLSPSRVE